MTNLVRTVVDHELAFRIRIPFFPVLFTVSTKFLFLGIGVLILMVLLSLPSGTLKLMRASLRNHHAAFISGTLASYFFFLTLTPSEPHFVSKGPAVILYLVVSTAGLALFFLGIRPAVTWALDNHRAARGIEWCFSLLKRGVLESPPLLFVGFLVLAEFALTNILSLVLFQHIPHIQDSIAQMFHAKIFAAGKLVAPAPPLPDFFETIHVIIHNGTWYSQYPPGHVFLLMLGVLAGVPWIINPLFAALTVGAMYFLGKEIHGELVGRLSALLTVLSPFVLFMSSEFMNHTTAIFFFVCFLLFFARALRTHRFLDGALAGAALGYLVNIRPYSAAALAFPFFLYALVQLRKRFSELRPAAIGMITLLVAFTGILLLFNTLTNGSPFLFGFQVLWGPNVNPGFGPGAWGEAHTPLRGFLQTLSNFNGLNKYLFELPVPSLLLIVLLFFTGPRNRWDLLYVAAFLSLATAYFFYWFQDWCFGPRFLFEAAAVLIVLTARGIERLPFLFTSVLGIPTSGHRVRVVSTAMLMVLFALGFATNIPPHLDFYGNSYWGVNADILNAVNAKRLNKAVVFVQGNYSRGFIGNSPFLNQPVLYVHDRGPDNLMVMERFPGYQYFVASGNDLEPISPRTYEEEHAAGGSGQSTSPERQEPSPRPSR